jgi:NAD dependent epimerase/dehydratase
MRWKNQSVLITGAGGFVGSHLTERLIDHGAHVRAFVKYNSRNDWGLLDLIPPQTLEKIDIIPGDLKDPDALRDAAEGVDIIFHLGSIIAIPYSYLHPREVIETNVVGTLNVLMAGKDRDVGRIIHTSTSEVYGTAQYVPIDEHHPLQGQSPYSASKIAADKIVESFYRTYSVPVTTIRPFNTYGPRQSARAVIPTIITQVLSGHDVRLGALHPTRDFTYVSDLTRAFMSIAESDTALGDVINIGSNFEISIGDLARKVIHLCNRDVSIVDDTARLRPEKSEVERLWCNNQKAKTVLDWSPSVPLDQGLKETIAWIADHISHYKPEIYNR